MTFHLPDDSTPFGEGVRRRVQEEYLAWLTVVDLHGMPLPAPIWFWWDEAVSHCLICSQAHAKRLDLVRTKTRTGSATSADLKDFSSGWPKNSADSPRFHVDRGESAEFLGVKRNRSRKPRRLRPAVLRLLGFSSGWL